MISKGHQGALVTLDERKSKLRLAFPVSNKTAELVTDSIITLLSCFKGLVHTLTFDNGKEFAQHEQVDQTIECDTYFAKPYHLWECGQNENANGLLRQYFPKAMGLLNVTAQQVLESCTQAKQQAKEGLGVQDTLRGVPRAIWHGCRKAGGLCTYHLNSGDSKNRKIKKTKRY